MNNDYPSIPDGEWQEPTPQTGYLWQCCDCGLTHRINFEVVGDKVQFQAFRDKKETIKARKKMIESEHG